MNVNSASLTLKNLRTDCEIDLEECLIYSKSSIIEEKSSIHYEIKKNRRDIELSLMLSMLSPKTNLSLVQQQLATSTILISVSADNWKHLFLLIT